MAEEKVKETQSSIETGQIYTLKSGVKIEQPDGLKDNLKQIKIGKYRKETEEKYEIKNMDLWEVFVKDKEGEWILSKRTSLFGKQILSRYDLEFAPMKVKKSRLSNIESE